MGLGTKNDCADETSKNLPEPTQRKYVIQWLRRDLLNGSKSPTPPSEEGNKSSSLNIVFCRIRDDGQSQKTCNPEITYNVSFVGITFRQEINDTFCLFFSAFGPRQLLRCNYRQMRSVRRPYWQIWQALKLQAVRSRCHQRHPDRPEGSPDVSVEKNPFFCEAMNSFAQLEITTSPNSSGSKTTLVQGIVSGTDTIGVSVAGLWTSL